MDKELAAYREKEEEWRRQQREQKEEIDRLKALVAELNILGIVDQEEEGAVGGMENLNDTIYSI